MCLGMCFLLCGCSGCWDMFRLCTIQRETDRWIDHALKSVQRRYTHPFAMMFFEGIACVHHYTNNRNHTVRCFFTFYIEL